MAKRSIASTNIRIGVSTAGLKKGLAVAQRSLKKFGASAKRMGASINSNVAMPFALAGAAGVKMALDLEKSFATIENLVGITGKALDDFKGSVKAVSVATGQSQQELSEALFTVASAGLRGAQATEVLERAAKASTIGLGETKSIAQALTGVLQAYSKEGLTAAQATDTLTAIVREGNLEAESLAPTLGRIVGVGAQLGISFEELGANIATFTRLGVPAEEAVVGLRGIMTTFLKPSSQAKTALAEMGLTADDLREKVGKEGLQSTLAFLMQQFEGNSDAMTAVFGNVRALSAVLGTAGAQGEAYAEVLHNIENAAGIVDDGFKNVSNTAGFKLNKSLNELRNVGLELGATLLPMVTKVAKFVQQALQNFNELSNKTKTQIVAVIALVAAGGPILSALGVLSGIIAAILSPVGLLIAGIVLAGAAVYKFWDQAKPIFVKIANAWIDLYNESTFFRVAIQGIVFAFKTLWTIGSGILNAFTKSFRAIGKIVLGVFSLDGDLAREGLREIGEVAFNEVQNIVDNVKTDYQEGMQKALAPKEKLELVTEEGLQQGVDNIKGFLGKKWKSILDMFTWGGITMPTAGGGGDGGGDDDGNGTDPDPNGTTEKKLTRLGIAWNNYTTQVQANAEQAAQAITGMVDSIIHEGLMQLGEALVTGKFDFKSFSTFILNSFATTAEQLGKLAISIGFASKGIFEALKGKPELAILAGGALLVLAGVARGQMAKMAENQKQVKLAKGGLAYGETLAVVGDNPNARMDPEVIAPLSKLQSMLGNAGGRVEVYGRLSGQDILLSTEKANRTRSRYRGF